MSTQVSFDNNEFSLDTDNPEVQAVVSSMVLEQMLTTPGLVMPQDPEALVGILMPLKEFTRSHVDFSLWSHEEHAAVVKVSMLLHGEDPSNEELVNYMADCRLHGHKIDPDTAWELKEHPR